MKQKPTKTLAKATGSEIIASCTFRIQTETSESFSIFSKYIPENPANIHNDILCYSLQIAASLIYIKKLMSMKEVRSVSLIFKN